MKKIITTIITISICSFSFSQKKDKAVMKDPKPGYFQNDIMTGIEQYDKKDETQKPAPKVFKMDFSNYDVPKDVTKYTSYWHNMPTSQGCTNTCWCFSTTSYLESEIFRITKQKIRLSEMFTVYYEYLEKAKRFVKERGNSAFGEGSESNAVTWMMREHGAVPWSNYNGMQNGQPFHDHQKMYKEMKDYLESVKQSNAWNENEIVATIKSILNHYIGEPPSDVTVDGKKMSPKDYLKNVCKLNMDDYVDVMSLMQSPYYQKAEYNVPDNWWHNSDYYNIPLDEFMKAVKTSIRSGYTVCIGGDVSEAGLDSWAQAAVVPSFDIPSEYIDESARQMRFSNGSTTDDHGVHLVGYMEKDGKDWYLIKDSGAGSRNCGKDSPCFGYYFFHEDFVKLKMMSFTVHKDAIKDILAKCKA